MRDIRLGDDIDDFCVRCKRVMNHAVVSVINAAPAKVRCRTCHSDHDYRHEQAPPPKVDLRKAALFNEVLKKVKPGEADALAAAVPDEAEIEVVATETDIVEDEIAGGEVTEEVEEIEEVEEAAIDLEAEPEAPKEKPVKAKTKATVKPAAAAKTKATKAKAKAKARK
jgi:hypothetical protein